jgi:Sec-independent protein translocase protein TatA
MGIFGHWYVLLIILLAILVLVGPRALPHLGTLFGRRLKETKRASIEAGQAFKAEITDGETGTPDPASSPAPGEVEK